MAEPAAASSSTGPTTGSPKAGPSTLPPLFVPPKPVPPKTPPKPILKKPPPPPQPFFSFTKSVFSISSKFLPQQGGGGSAGTSRGIPPAPSNGSAPTNGKTPETPTDPSPLKRAHFIIPHQQTTYPISSQAPPSTPGLQESIKDIEEREAERRIRDCNDSNWSLERVEEFYKECCRQREEAVLVPVIRAIQSAGPVAPRTLDLTGIKLTQFSAATLADALSMEWGLRRLVLKDCDLDDLSLKPILHALLIPQTLPYLSLAGNKRLKPPAYKLIGIFAQKANALQFLDLSGTPLEKRSVEYIIGALESAPPSQPKSSTDVSPSFTPISPSTPLMSEGGSTSYFNGTAGSRPTDGLPPSGFSTPSALGVFFNGHNSPRPNGAGTPLNISPNPSFSNLPLSPTDGPGSPRVYRVTLPPKIPKAKLISLRLDECGVRGGSLEVLAHAVRPSCLVNLSLRGNRIGPTGAVALALMMKDYPDSMPVVHGSPGLLPPGSPQPNQMSFGSGLGLETPPSPRPSPFASSNNAPPKPPPRHPLLQQQATAPNPAPGAPIQPTYTPYIPRARRNMVPAPQPQNIPLITSSKTGGVTTRHNPPPAHGSPLNRAANLSGRPGAGDLQQQKTAVPQKVDGHSAALLDKVRSLDNLPRLGSLQTLDIRGNDLRTGVTYIAQVLKRNRTLKVLNLSENRVDVLGLVAVAEALKYNSTLETLDMSRNPCCGPGLEGITSIRTAFTINTSLKRLFLSNTNLTSPGAIALAEFLPEARHLLHLDLTANPLDIAGVMALSVGLKMNETIRCLDVNVPPNDPEYARLSREILKCCVRNTEQAAGEVGRFEHGGSSLGSGDVLGLGLGFGPPGGARGGVWGLIEKSELAKVVKEEAEKERLSEEQRQLGTLSGKEKYDVWKKTPPEIIRAAKECSENLQLLLGGILPADNGRKERLVERAQALASVIAEMVQVEGDTDTLQELLSLNDELLGFVRRIKSATSSLTLDMPTEVDPSELLSPTKIDRKGKGRATPQDEEPPEGPFSFRPKDEDRLLEEEEERKDGHPSPVERSRKWVEEEGEVFRKGQVLLGPEEMGDVEEGDGAQVSGEELRVELLEAQVERPRPRLVEPGYEGSEDVITSPRREGSEERRTPLSPR
ncbi:hypothetical protein FRC04_006793 [Tulasnella sp. 424]|nr:hypothetical protein FRC04_006793 [Tulasnella sp. 424]KAG8974337.1 hypothetical protein FRC05_007643 [Tulasnella sp. 425]